jgi:hypothetical protein
LPYVVRGLSVGYVCAVPSVCKQKRVRMEAYRAKTPVGGLVNDSRAEGHAQLM